MAKADGLTALQLAIMQVLWDRGRTTVAEITEALRPGRRLAPTTVATVLSRLEKRGVVGHTTRGRSFVYWSEITQAQVRLSMVNELVERMFGGDVTALVAHLVRDPEIGEADLVRLRSIITGRTADLRRARG